MGKKKRNDPNPGMTLLSAVLSQAMNDRPSVSRGPDGRLKPYDREGVVYTAAIDDPVGRCTNPTCSMRDGVLVIASKNTPPEWGPTVALVSVLGHQEDRASIVRLDVETAKQLVNRLGEAIAVAESLV